MLDIQTYDARQGGNVLYKALAHPLAAEAISSLAGQLRQSGPLAVYDPDGAARMLFALHPEMPMASEVYVQAVMAVGQPVDRRRGRSPISGVRRHPCCWLRHSTRSGSWRGFRICLHRRSAW